MKVLLVNTSDHAGGAAIASLRLLKALRANGVEAQLLVRDRTLPAGRTDIIGLRPTLGRKLKFVIERLEIFLRNGLSRQGLFAVDTGRCGNDITRLEAFREADVIHLHWINQAMLSLDDLRRILQSGKAVVWTLHDMWPLTGICHHADTCEGWLNRCGHCPLLRYPAKGDLSATTFARKRAVYATGHISFVGCSRWLANLARKAPLLAGQRVTDIPNPLDTSYYAPPGLADQPARTTVRDHLGLPRDKKLMLFAAFKATDPGKGIDLLEEALTLLVQSHPEQRDRLGLIIAGHESETLAGALPIATYPMGYVGDEARMRDLYQAADLLVMPTLMDNLPNTIAEAMACGVPCVAFGVGGVPQMVDTGVNGYLARPRDPADLARGILRILTSPNAANLSDNARAKALTAYSESRVAAAYLRLYEEAVERAAHHSS